MMHRQLHHMGEVDDVLAPLKTNVLADKSHTVPRASAFNSQYLDNKEGKGLKLSRTSSAIRLFDKLRARIARSRTLFAHPEESGSISTDINELSVPSECTSKAFKSDSSRTSGVSSPKELHKETYGCHLCSFDADRITALDRHLLNDHKIGLDILLKLVMAKTKDGLSEDPLPTVYGVRQPYYKPLDDVIEDGEFIVETITPKIKIMKHAITNTDITWSDIPDLKNNCRMISKELEKLIDGPTDSGKEELLAKMQTLNACMCKFADSSNALTKVLKKEIDAKSARERLSGNETLFELGLGDRGTPRDWEKAHSERLERNKAKHNRGDKTKLSSESFYF
ncbi:hypothetical protein O3G_MSEX003778 [Manduca sexta]|uniref:Uncharacterized protein n=1 Tax=Manduca sexta TaxID=7130 RepID=A0A921YUC0_MANSE|nr:hypothetical protein O3G_MSEX003778 [Manduca sexta]